MAQQVKCHECGSYKWDKGKAGESARAMLIGGPAILVLSQVYQRSFPMQVVNVFQLIAVLVLLGGVALLLVTKSRCANCGYVPSGWVSGE